MVVLGVLVVVVYAVLLVLLKAHIFSSGSISMSLSIVSSSNMSSTSTCWGTV